MQRRPFPYFPLLLLTVLTLGLAGCPSTPDNADPAVARGRQVYISACIACHNADPAQAGPLGPAVKGASRELLEARLMRAEYPQGYTPKRDTKLMVAMPQFEKSIDDLTAYLK